jgi:hypothetical protein
MSSLRQVDRLDFSPFQVIVFLCTYERYTLLNIKLYLFFIFKGAGQDFVVFGLQDGSLYFKLSIKNNVFEKNVQLSSFNLHNNNWHSVKFLRRQNQVK